MNKSIFRIAKMDCSAEERLIRLALEVETEIKFLDFDLAKKRLTAVHLGTPERILSILKKLRLGVELKESTELSNTQEILAAPSSDTDELTILKKVFAINAVMFVIGFVGGLISQSTGLVADSLDMFADAAVFGLSMYVVGKAPKMKKRAAKLSGYLQMLLAIFATSEVIRRFATGSRPEASYMMVIASISFAANASCMFLMAKHRKGEIHLRASWIFLSNDVIANFGVLMAGCLVMLTHSQLPDIVTGAIISGIVFSSSIRILKAANA